MTESDNPETHVATAPFRLYALIVFCFTLVVYLLPFALIRAPHFERWDSTAFGGSLEWGYTLEHEDADVVLFGDSSALYGIDPLRVSQTVGLKTINLPNVLTSLLVMDDRELKHYLAHNKAPRLIVFYFTPWDLDYRKADPAFPTNEGDMMMLRHGTATDILGYYRNHPSEYLVFPFKFYRWLDLNSIRKLTGPHGGPADLERSGGHMGVGVSELLTPACRLPAQVLAASSSMKTVRLMAARYASAQTRVMVYVAPIPNCAGATTVLENNFSQLPASSPLVLAPRYFVADGNYAHPGVDGLPVVSDQLSSAILHTLTGGTR